LLAPQQAAPDLDRVIGLNLGGQVGDDTSVDADLAGGDEFLDAAAGAETGGSEKSIKAHVGKKWGEGVTPRRVKRLPIIRSFE
jgi:hypothetical protein